jgi:hypothetical protein
MDQLNGWKTAMLRDPVRENGASEENAVADGVDPVVLPVKGDVRKGARDITALLQSSPHWMLTLTVLFPRRKSKERFLL